MNEQVKREVAALLLHILKCAAVVLLVYIATELALLWAKGGGK